jgi:hypothetical protein
MDFLREDITSDRFPNRKAKPKTKGNSINVLNHMNAHLLQISSSEIFQENSIPVKNTFRRQTLLVEKGASVQAFSTGFLANRY